MSSLRPSDRRRRQRRVVAVAVTVGALAVAALIAIFAASLFAGDRPEEEVAQRFLASLYEGDGAAAYVETAPSYRRYVFEDDLDRLADVLSAAAGPDATLEIVGSARDTPATALVGYRGAGNGPFRGAVSLVELDDRWWVIDVSFRFPEAPDDVQARLEDVLRQLNAGIAERADDQVQPEPGG